MAQRESLAPLQARRVALAAQGFGTRLPGGGVLDQRRMTAAVRKLGLLQIDSVNVLARAHYVPLYSRYGSYDRGLLEQLAYRKPRRLFEYWAHEASLVPVELHPLLRWRMERAAFHFESWGRPARLAKEHPGYIEAVLDEVRDRGPIGVSELSTAGTSEGAWWGWSDGKVALEWLFWIGAITTAGRRGFERLYDVTERVIPPAVLAVPTPAPEEAQRELLRISARALGVATEPDLRDYFRLKPQQSKPRVAELVEAGDLVPVSVPGWRHPAYLHRDARVPREVRARALLSPFDPLVFFRDRTLRLWDFHYRIEIYVPAPKRVYGYYVLPFLLGDDIVARVDLKADRAAGVLVVQAAHREPAADEAEVARELAAELRELAAWLDLSSVAVAPRGDLAAALAAEVARVA